MPVVQLQEVESLPDILSTEHFTLNLGTLPGAGDAYHLLLKCADANIPGFSNEAFEAMLHGTVRNFRGRKMYPRSLSVTFLEDSTMATLNALRIWHEQIVGTNSNTSIGDIAAYGVNGVLTIYDQAGNGLDQITFMNLFLNDVPDVQVSGESTQIFRVPATFKYDYIQYSGVTIR